MTGILGIILLFIGIAGWIILFFTIKHMMDLHEQNIILSSVVTADKLRKIMERNSSLYIMMNYHKPKGIQYETYRN